MRSAVAESSTSRIFFLFFAVPSVTRPGYTQTRASNRIAATEQNEEDEHHPKGHAHEDRARNPVGVPDGEAPGPRDVVARDLRRRALELPIDDEVGRAVDLRIVKVDVPRRQARDGGALEGDAAL